MSSSILSSKRSAAEANLPSGEAVVVVAPSSSIQSAPSVSSAEVAELQAHGGPAPQPQVEGFTHPVDTVAHESAAHKAKRLATDASHSVSQAVTAGMESAAVVLDKAKVQAEHALAAAKEWGAKELVRTEHSNATVANPPYNMLEDGHVPVRDEATLRDKAHNAINSAQFALEHAAEATLAAAKTAAAKISEAASHVGPAASSTAGSLKEGVQHLQQKAAAQGITAESVTASVKDGAASLAAGASATAAQVKSALAHSTGVDAKAQVSDASHSMEKREGSLPVERNADEFPHAKHEQTTTILQPGHSGLGTDRAPLKIDEAALPTKTQTDIAIGNASVNV